MNNLDKQYQQLLEDILNYGVEKRDRTETGTKSIFGYTIRHNMKDGFPLLTTKKMAWKSIVTELLWFLRGDTNITYLVENGCHIWNGDAYKNYLDKTKHEFQLNSELSGHPHFNLSKEGFVEKIKTDKKFAKEYGELGPIYGKQWRQWQGWMTTSDGSVGSIWYDQISRLINLLKTNPDSRRLMVNAWNVGELDEMILPPCHYSFQVYTRDLTETERHDIWFRNNYETGFEYYKKEKINFDDPYWKPTPSKAISLLWNQRSVDTFLGLPFNIASYGLLLMLLGKIVGMVPDQLIGNLGDTHLYLNHLEQAKEQISRKSFELPWVELNFDFKFKSGYLIDWDKVNLNQIELMNYLCNATIKAPLSN